MSNILKATQKFSVKNIIIWPNSDAGSEEVSKQIEFLEKEVCLKTKL